MEFADILEQTIALLQHQGRLSYGALKRRFGLDNACLDQPQDRTPLRPSNSPATRTAASWCG